MEHARVSYSLSDRRSKIGYRAASLVVRRPWKVTLWLWILTLIPPSRFRLVKIEINGTRMKEER
jgi:hypothetical protein